MKKLLFLIALIFNFAFASAFVAQFEVIVETNNARVNEPLDLTIKAVDDLWNVVVDYVWDILILLEWHWFDAADLPSDWIYSFRAEDQWEVKFTKWLTFRQEWTFELVVEDFLDFSISGMTEVNVWNPDDWLRFNVDIVSPVQWSTVKGSSVNVIWTTDAPNTIYEIFVNWTMVRDDITSPDGDINLFLDPRATWNLSLYINLLDIENNIVGVSETVNFTFQPEDDNFFKSIEIRPWNTVNEWDQISVVVNTIDSVETAELVFEWYSEFVMDRQSNGVFFRSINMNDAWSYEISLNLMSNWVNKNYKNVDVINVIKERVIRNIRFEKFADSNSIDFEWTYSWEIPRFKFAYAKTQAWLDSSDRDEIIVDVNKVLLNEIDVTEDLYVKVYPLNLSNQVDWTPSTIVLVEWTLMWSPSCTVAWIQLKTEEVDWKHYLVWWDVEWAENYEIFISDNEKSSIRDMQKVGETTQTRFEFPFDADAESEIYKWYAVQAKCIDWTSLQIDWMAKVKVWPLTNILLFLLISLFFYVSYTLYRYNK